MGHKSIVIFDHDVLDRLESDPAAFVKQLRLAMFTHRRLGGDVHHAGATVAKVVWSGHVNETPILKFEDFAATKVTYEDIKPIVDDHHYQIQLDSPN